MIKSRRLVAGQSREEARAALRPGNFQGSPPRGRSHEAVPSKSGKSGRCGMGNGRLTRQSQDANDHEPNYKTRDPVHRIPMGSRHSRLLALDKALFDRNGHRLCPAVDT